MSQNSSKTAVDVRPPWMIRAINALGSGLGRRTLRLDAEQLMKAAREKTGLADFGGEEFLEPLRQLIRSFEEEGQLSLLGQVAMRGLLRDLLSQRLQIAETFKRHPEILETPLPRPLFITGFTRTGTTLLFNLLARMPGARALRLWEVLAPAPPPDPATEANDPRVAAARRLVQQGYQSMPALKTIHPLDATGPEECVFVLDLSFSNFTLEARAPLPSYVRWLLRNSLLPTYRYYRQVLQLLNWKVRGQHMVAKNTAHLFALDSLLTCFPDARIIQTHRDPREVVASSCSLYEASRGVTSRDRDPVALGRHWLDIWGQGMDRALAVRATASPEQFLDVHFKDMMADPVGQVQRIHRWAGLGGEEAAPAVVKAWLAENPRNKHGVHGYQLEHYGLTPDQVAERFRAYTSRFGIS